MVWILIKVCHPVDKMINVDLDINTGTLFVIGRSNIMIWILIKDFICRQDDKC